MFGAWLPKHLPPDSKLPIVHAVMKELKGKGIERFGFIGYCFGGRMSTLLAAEEQVTKYCQRYLMC